MVRALTLTALSLSLRAPCCCTRWRARERVECEDARRDVYYRAASLSSSLGELKLLLPASHTNSLAPGAEDVSCRCFCFLGGGRMHL